MMKLYVLLIFMSLGSVYAQQNKGIDSLWTKCYGGSQDEPFGYLENGRVSSDINSAGDLFVVSNTQSNDGMVHGNHGLNDCWLIKLNADGDTLWTKTFGGEDYDYPESVIALPDGGCMVCGYSFSVTGDLVGHHGDNSEPDGFIARFDSHGNMLWGKQYGGYYTNISVGADYLYGLTRINDSTFISTGETSSNNGDLHLNLNLVYSGWFLKINGNGKILQSIKIGSITADTGYIVETFYNQALLSDGAHLMLYGETNYGLYGPERLWIVKTDLAGNVINQIETGCESQNWAGGIVACDSNCAVLDATVFETSGDVTEKVDINGQLWTFKLNSDLKIVKHNAFGGNGSDQGLNITMDKNGDFLCSGLSTSKLYDPPGDSLGSDFFAIKIDKDLNLQWYLKIGGSNRDIASDIILTPDNTDFYFIGQTESDDGYVHGNHGMNDVWVGKFVNVVNGIEKPRFQNAFSLYPIPANDKVYINPGTFENNIQRYSIYDVNGRLITFNDNVSLNDNLITVNIVDFKPGIYFISLSGNNFIESLKFIKD